MRIIHRISISATSKDRIELAAFGIAVRENKFTTFEVDEEHEHWSDLANWIQARRAVDFVNTKFSKKEIDAAEWLALLPNWHHGYPQPDDDIFGYLDATFDLTDYCKRCGIGMKQKLPFQMKKEPKWGRNGILQLNWIFDEYFTTPEIWMSVFQPIGIACRPVIDRKGVELKTVVQLVVKEEVGIVTDTLLREKCSSCGRMKFLPVTRGPFPPLEERPLASMVKTKEYFGSGGSAHRSVLISQQLTQILRLQKVQGAAVKPVKRTSIFLNDFKSGIRFEKP
ncbi:hypothetical protein [Leptospira alstonii]|uniref:hypothetical protein n=1 Tax=Leptospira alstonii TaxID=28452 RepID=UPI000774B626|nr:hypothetical protein [Leptospira alstonii]